LVMNMYYYLYSDDEYENEFVEVVMVYYDNDDDFVLSINEHNIYPQVLNCEQKKTKGVEEKH
jgi:hypothetical protein